MNRSFSSPPSQQKHDKTNILCTCDIWPLFPFSYHHFGQRIIHVISKQEVLRWSQSVRVEAIPGVGSSSCRPSGGVPALLNFILSGQCLIKWPHSYSQELIVQEIKCWTLKRKDHLMKSCFLLFLLMLSEDWPEEEIHGVCTEKKTWIYFSLPAKRKEKIFSTVCMRDFFFKLYVLMVINWNVL